MNGGTSFLSNPQIETREERANRGLPVEPTITAGQQAAAAPAAFPGAPRSVYFGARYRF